MAHLTDPLSTVPSSTTKENATPAFTISSVLRSSIYDAPVQTYLSANPTVTNPLASAAVFYHHDEEPAPRVLLLQRAPADTLPLKWEVPGGSVDMGIGGDASLIHGAVRELHEETGLVARHVVRTLGVHREFYEEVVGENRTLTWRMVIFEVEVDLEEGGMGMGLGEGSLPRIKLAPEEHVQYLWCSEEEIRAGRCGNVELEFTHPDWTGIILGAFDSHRDSAS